MENCTRCEDVPEPLPREGTLHLLCPIEHTREKIRRHLEDRGFDPVPHSEQRISIDYQSDGLEEGVKTLRNQLSEEEKVDIRAVALPTHEEPTIDQFMQTRSLSELIGLLDSTWLIELLEEEKLQNDFHPIVSSNDPRDIFGYECLLRCPDAEKRGVSVGELFDLARKSGLLFHMDRSARINAVRSAVDEQILPEYRAFINYQPSSIYDPEYCLRTTVEAAGQRGVDPEHFVFEVVETDKVDDIEKLKDTLTYYRDRGFQVALDDVGAGYSSLDLVAELEPDYLKMDLKLVQGVSENEIKRSTARSLLDLAASLGIQTIAEGIETREQMEWFRENGADYQQGYLFARPDTPPPIPDLD